MLKYTETSHVFSKLLYINCLIDGTVLECRPIFTNLRGNISSFKGGRGLELDWILAG